MVKPNTNKQTRGMSPPGTAGRVPVNNNINTSYLPATLNKKPPVRQTYIEVSDSDRDDEDERFDCGESDSNSEASAASGKECPVCLESMDDTDLQLYPCVCGYQICLWCLQKIRDSDSNRCPLCRREYDEKEFRTCTKLSKDNKIKPVRKNTDSGTSSMYAPSHTVPSKVTAARRGSSSAASSAANMSKNMKHIRIIQQNLCYIKQIPETIAKPEVLEEFRFFGKYGKVVSVILNPYIPKTSYSSTTSAELIHSYTAFICFAADESCGAAIKDIEKMRKFNVNHEYGGLRASYGTTKYCSIFVKGQICTNDQCAFVHKPVTKENANGERVLSTATKAGASLYDKSIVAMINNDSTIPLFSLLRKEVDALRVTLPPPIKTIPEPTPASGAPISKRKWATAAAKSVLTPLEPDGVVAQEFPSLSTVSKKDRQESSNGGSGATDSQQNSRHNSSGNPISNNNNNNNINNNNNNFNNSNISPTPTTSATPAPVQRETTKDSSFKPSWSPNSNQIANQMNEVSADENSIVEDIMRTMEIVAIHPPPEFGGNQLWRNSNTSETSGDYFITSDGTSKKLAEGSNSDAMLLPDSQLSQPTKANYAERQKNFSQQDDCGFGLQQNRTALDRNVNIRGIRNGLSCWPNQQVGEDENPTSSLVSVFSVPDRSTTSRQGRQRTPDLTTDSQIPPVDSGLSSHQLQQELCSDFMSGRWPQFLSAASTALQVPPEQQQQQRSRIPAIDLPVAHGRQNVSSGSVINVRCLNNNNKDAASRLEYPPYSPQVSALELAKAGLGSYGYDQHRGLLLGGLPSTSNMSSAPLHPSANLLPSIDMLGNLSNSQKSQDLNNCGSLSDWISAFQVSRNLNSINNPNVDPDWSHTQLLLALQKQQEIARRQQQLEEENTRQKSHLMALLHQAFAQTPSMNPWSDTSSGNDTNLSRTLAAIWEDNDSLLNPSSVAASLDPTTLFSSNPASWGLNSNVISTRENTSDNSSYPTAVPNRNPVSYQQSYNSHLPHAEPNLIIPGQFAMFNGRFDTSNYGVPPVHSSAANLSTRNSNGMPTMKPSLQPGSRSSANQVSSGASRYAEEFVSGMPRDGIFTNSLNSNFDGDFSERANLRNSRQSICSNATAQSRDREADVRGLQLLQSLLPHASVQLQNAAEIENAANNSSNNSLFLGVRHDAHR